VKAAGKFGGAGHDRASWLALLLLLVALLAPTAGVLWFMNEAVNNQRDVARQKLAEAYRGQLALVRDRLEAYWEKRASDLERKAGAVAAVAFQSCVTERLADSAVFLNPLGGVAYPSGPSFLPAAKEQHPEAWVEARRLENTPGRLAAAAEAYARIAVQAKDTPEAARAIQAQVRSLVQGGETEAALRLIEQQFASPHLARAADLQGRSIAADEQLLAVNLTRGQEGQHEESIRRLDGTLADYGVPMPSSQRLFLMEEVRAASQPGREISFPTYEAERLAGAFLEARPKGRDLRAGEPGLRPSELSGVWKLPVAGGRVIALYRSEALLATVRRVLNEANPSADLDFGIVPPGTSPQGIDEAAAAGPLLPGWRVTMAIRNRKLFDETALRQRASYFWIGFLVIATMAVLAIVAGQALRRQMRLARLKTDLVASVSHEIKTPLSSMRLLVDALLEDRELEARKTREYLELIARENSRLSRVIDNFLTFSRMERNRQRFEFATTEPERVVGTVVEAAGERFQAPSCRFDVEVAPSLPPLRADQDALVAVLLNLLDNAYRFSPEEKHIRLRAFPGDGSVCFAVADNGIGIPAREQRKIFRRFYQVDQRLTRPTGGCGLGLSIVEFIVQAHGGKIEVSSEPGVGSTFTVSLPCGVVVEEVTV
jgi:signal transduction histidine kinase